ncbi:MAG: aminodeoxychorismate lyase, partial [Gammaproteobacteria bacterium]|nr:aminodeoxychorismate lyase [Gammaproteobacteria bacterium]
MSTVLVNGHVTDQLSIKDRGLNYGDGVFETIAVSGRHLHYWSEHFRRLKQGCERLAIKAPLEAELLADIKKLSFPNEPSVLKIVVSRGQGGRGYAATGIEQASVIISLNSWPDFVLEYQQRGVNVRICQHRLMINPALAGIKHLNRLDQVLARNEWHNDQIHEGIMLDQHDYLIEGVSTNLFVMVNNQWLTPAVTDCAVAGIMRELILNKAELIKLKIEQRKIQLSELSSVQQMFVCNSIWGIVPVTGCGS